MIQPERFMDLLLEHGIGLVSGVPCSYLTGLINTAITHPGIDYVGAANEGDAVAVACGAELGNMPAAVMFQNSGLGNAVSPLTSLTATFRIPVLVIVTWRGQPGGPPDEPQHQQMGSITRELLDLMEIPWRLLPSTEDELAVVLDKASAHLRRRQTPFALLVRKGSFATSQRTVPGGELPCAPLTNASAEASVAWEPDAVLRTVQSSLRAEDAIVATTGYTGRALYALGDNPNQLYMVGSMGCASSLGLGLAKAQPERRIVVLDGDGALLMRMGAAAVLGHERPANLTHVVLDNGVHDSTGGQSTVSRSMNLSGIANACGYPRALRINHLDELASELRSQARDLTFLHVTTKPRSDRKLPRPQLPPEELVKRFRQWMNVPCMETI